VRARRFAYGSSGHAEFSQALRDVVVAVMIEKKVAVDHLEEILAVPGARAKKLNEKSAIIKKLPERLSFNPINHNKTSSP
jgi:hypothetical protein